METPFRDAKQLCGFTACQCRLDLAQEKHMAFVLLAFLVLQMLCRDPKETLGAVKARVQRDVLVGQAPAPRVLKGKGVSGFAFNCVSPVTDQS